MKNFLALLFSLFLLSPVANAGGVMLSDLIVTEMLPGSKSTAGYFTLMNHSDKAVTLKAAQSDLSSRVEIHEHIMSNGIMKMQKVTKGIVVKPHGSVTFAPGGYHLMIFKDKKKIKRGMDFQLTLLLDNDKSVSGSGKVISVLQLHEQNPKSDHSHHH